MVHATLWAALAAFGCSNPASPTSPTQLPKFYFEGSLSEDQKALAPKLYVEQEACYGFKGHAEEVVIKGYPGGFFCGPTFAAGCTWIGRIGVSTEEKVYENALAHEFLHFFELQEGKVADYAHSRPYWAKCDWRNR